MSRKIQKHLMWGVSGVLFAVIFGDGMIEVKAQTQKMQEPLRAGASAVADFKDVEGKSKGQAMLENIEHGVLIRLALKDLPAGEHAIHIHETGKCTPMKTESDVDTTDYFSDAGSHFNPEDHKHGFFNESGYHAGDMENINIPKDGELEAQIFNTKIALGEAEGRANIFDEDGSAIIIHEGADDYHSAPTGRAGDRIACAVIEKK